MCSYHVIPQLFDRRRWRQPRSNRLSTDAHLLLGGGLYELIPPQRTQLPVQPQQAKPSRRVQPSGWRRSVHHRAVRLGLHPGLLWGLVVAGQRWRDRVGLLRYPGPRAQPPARKERPECRRTCRHYSPVKRK